MKKILFIGLCSLFLCGCSFDEGMEWLGFEKTSSDNGSSLSLTKSKYDKIETGMSYTRVKFILGGDCELQYENTTSYEEYKSYVCWDKDDSSKRIVISFEDDKLTSKSQMGL